MPIDPFAERVTELNDAPVRKDAGYVLYWMQSAQRESSNHALEFAIARANELTLPVLVGFGLAPSYPGATMRHYRFMLEGLQETTTALQARGVPMVVRLGDPPAVAIDLARDAALLVTERAYLTHLRRWRFDVARTVRCSMVEVESELVVPVEAASTKAEYAARTIRPRVNRNLGRFLAPLDRIMPHERRDTIDVADRPITRVDLSNIDALMQRLRAPATPGPVSRFYRGGSGEAERRLNLFLNERLDLYEAQKSEPGLDVNTTLSPYLHFGQISALQIALAVGAEEFVRGLEAGRAEMKLQPGSVGMRTTHEMRSSARDALLEELLVRRGLAFNYTWFTPEYDQYSSLPGWARDTLASHASDPRPSTYSVTDLEAAQTHDEHWNNAMREMMVTGYMHNYMRMYWGKKILEWSASPEEAYVITRDLNDKWFLDGRDPNSYANVGWVFGLHDRPWTERAIFGKVRYMNARGLERKFDMGAYALKVKRFA